MKSSKEALEGTDSWLSRRTSAWMRQMDRQMQLPLHVYVNACTCQYRGMRRCTGLRTYGCKYIHTYTYTHILYTYRVRLAHLLVVLFLEFYVTVFIRVQLPYDVWYMRIYPYACACVCHWVRPNVWWCVYVCACCATVSQPVRPSVFLSVWQSVWQSVCVCLYNMLVCSYVRMFVCPYVSLESGSLAVMFVSCWILLKYVCL